MPPSIAREPTPDWLNKKNHPAAFPQAGDAGRVTGSKPLMPTLQPSVGTAMAQKMSNVHVAAPAAAPAAPSGSASGTAEKPAAASKHALDDEDATDEESEHELTPEEQANADHIAHVNSVIAAAEAAGFTFGKTKWVAAETFVNNKEIFDDAGVDVTECVFEGRKEISLNQVKSKLAELRAAAEERKRQQAMVPKQDESQFDFDESGSEEEGKDETEEEGEFAALSEAQLNARVAEMKTNLAIKMKQHDVGPVKAVLREYKDALKTDKSLTRDEMLTRKQKCIIIKTYFTEDLREKEYDEFQYQMLSELCAAEVTKKRLPDEIDSLEKKIEKAEEARNTLVTKRAITNAANAISRRKKREADAVSTALGTPTSKRLKNRK